MSRARTNCNIENDAGKTTSVRAKTINQNKSSQMAKKDRKPLGVIQSVSSKNDGKEQKRGQIKIYEDPIKVKPSLSTPTSPLSRADKGAQTKLTGKDLTDYQDMVQPDVQFYKDLAEKRREALNESLKENEELWIENEEKDIKLEEKEQENESLALENMKHKQRNEYLEERVTSLEETVEKARKITEMIGPYLNDEEEDKLDPDGDTANTPRASSGDSVAPERKLEDFNDSSYEEKCLGQVNCGKELEDETAKVGKQNENDSSVD